MKLGTMHESEDHKTSKTNKSILKETPALDIQNGKNILISIFT